MLPCTQAKDNILLCLVLPFNYEKSSAESISAYYPYQHGNCAYSKNITWLLC